MLDNKNENSTTSSQDQRNYHSNMRMINSQHLTPEMAVSYLYKWRNDIKYIDPLLKKLYDLVLNSSVHYIPTIIYIMSLEGNELFQKFCEKIAMQSISHYLLIRWSYSTYLDFNKKKTESIIAKLDSSILAKRNQETQFSEIQKRTQYKYHLSNYTQIVNVFFQKIFAIPEKLKHYEKLKRGQKLKQYLSKISQKYLTNTKIQFIQGIAFPIDIKSNIVVSIISEHCFPFSTKERVPFKLVLETISHKDAEKIKNNLLPQYKDSQSQEKKINKESYVWPSSYFGKEWKIIKEEITKNSKFGMIRSHEIKCYMVKSGDDLRQEYMAMQLISLFNEIFQKQNIKIWIRPYSIIPYSSDSGLIEFIDDTRTISYLKEVSKQRSLKNIYKQIFGLNWQASITNFIQSLAGYSLIQYYFDIKDRHNNNILIDIFGHMIHIDFSFMLSSSPGNMNFQRAPFKLTTDYIELMQGVDSDIFQHFKLLFFLGVKYIRKYKKEITQMIMMMTELEGMKCFLNFDRKRLQSKFLENTTDAQLWQIVQKIIKDACNSYTTSQYDFFQWYTNKIQI